MDVDLRHTHMNDDEIIVRKSYSQIEVSFICVRKPSGADRARIEDITKQLQCSLSKFYWLINREKETKSLITTDMIATMMNRVRNDTMNVFISTLKCGHYESQLAVYPTIKPATLYVCFCLSEVSMLNGSILGRQPVNFFNHRIR